MHAATNIPALSIHQSSGHPHFLNHNNNHHYHHPNQQLMSPSSTTLEDVLASLLGLPASSTAHRSSGTNL